MKSMLLATLVTVLFVFPCSLMSQASAADSLSLDAVVRRVLETHPAIKEATQGVLASQARVRVSRSSSYPDIEAHASYARLEPVTSIDLPGQGSFELFPANNYDAHLAVRHTLLDFGKRGSLVDYARSLEQTADDNVELVQTALVFDAIDTFYAIIFLERSLGVQDQQVTALNRHLELTREQVRTGSATDFDVLTTEVRVATARSRRIDLVNGIERQTERLRGLIGLPGGEPLRLAGGFPSLPMGLSADSLVALALVQRPELRLSRDAEATASILERRAAITDRPSVDLHGAVGLKNGYRPDLNEPTANWTAGVAVQVPIFDGFRTRSEVAETRAATAAAQDHTRDIERRVTTEVMQALADVRSSMQKLEASEVQVRQAEAAVSMATVRYEAGVITNLDVLDAQTSLEEARLIRLGAQYQLVRSRYELDRAVGTRVWPR